MEISSDYTASLLEDIKPALIPSTPAKIALPSRPRDLGVQLDLYIALGAIASSIPAAEDVSTTTWNEVLDANFFSAYLSGSYLNKVLKLFHANWIRATHIAAPFGMLIIRFYLLPDDVAQAIVERDSRSLRSLLPGLISSCNISPRLWDAKGADLTMKFDPWASPIDKSLYWMFNTLPSPQPTADDVPDRYSCVSLNEFLDADPKVPGLKAKLYPYQARSVALMIQKETASHIHLDPRYEERVGPDGKTFFYNPRNSMFRREAPRYEAVRGGILAESMGLGKTVICLALMLATKDHIPRIPPQRLPGLKVRTKMGSLSQMVAATANRIGISLKAHFRWTPTYASLNLDSIINVLNEEKPVYEIASERRQSVRRQPVLPPPRKVTLCSATIVVVPNNLLQQWRSEFKKHVSDDENGLRVLVMDNHAKPLPTADRLLAYDVILFSKSRFEAEVKDGVDSQGRNANNVRAGCQCPYIGSSRERDCSCFSQDDVYCSPLKQLHFLRIIVDEGHDFSSKSTNAVRVATKLVTAERRWVVSGTPAKDKLFGVDVELASNVEAEELAHLVLEQEEGTSQAPITAAETQTKIATALERRKRFSKNEESKGAAHSIGILAAHFLQVEPWSSTENGDKIDWDDYAFRHESQKVRTYSAFSRCMDATLKDLVVKTRPEDVNKDVCLPPLDHKVIRLNPSYHDMLTINLFILFLTANAVTSEREDTDYLFHPKSTAERHRLLQNLRRSAFFWTGWSVEDVKGAIGHGKRYLEKEDTKASQEDRTMLQECLDFANHVLGSNSWKAMSLTHELGIFVDSWPGVNSNSWSLNSETQPFMIGATQLKTAQRLVDDQLFGENPLEGLDELGVAEVEEAMAAGQREREEKAKKQKDGPGSKLGVPTSGFQDRDIRHKSNSTARKQSTSSPKKKGNKLQQVSNGATKNKDTSSIATTALSEIQSHDMAVPTKSVKRKRSDSVDQQVLPSESPLAKPCIVGTVSSKLSYLLSRVMELQKDEKILIFYDSDNIAWYIAQFLELMHIKHLIYARNLKPIQRSHYITTFDTDDTVRILLMDLAHGAWGLNINKASRVFFVNPPFKPHTEAQAIKRAHRIGQTKPVFVETLILCGTVEEAIFERSRKMTREEHDQASKEISDDKGVAEIIQSAKRLDIRAENGKGRGQKAPLAVPLQIFGREGRGDMKIEGIDKSVESNSVKEPKRRRKGKKTEATEAD